MARPVVIAFEQNKVPHEAEDEGGHDIDEEPPHQIASSFSTSFRSSQAPSSSCDSGGLPAFGGSVSTKARASFSQPFRSLAVFGALRRRRRRSPPSRRPPISIGCGVRAGDCSGVRVLADADEEAALRSPDQHVAGEHEASAAEHLLFADRQACERRPQPADHRIVRHLPSRALRFASDAERKHRIVWLASMQVSR